MNYACAFLALILIAAMVYWYISGRKFYSGPLIEARTEDGDSAILADSSSNEKGDDKV